MPDNPDEKKQRLGSVASMFDKLVDEKEEKNTQEKEKKHQSNIIDGKKVRMVTLSSIRPDPNQPRKNIDPDSQEIKELAESIKQHGFINFITVREDGPRDYIIVTGERRYTAANIAGLEYIPVMVIAEDKGDIDYALLQLEENLQREDLTPFEEAAAFQRFQDEFGLNQKEIAKRTGKDTTYISRIMQINKLSQLIHEEIEKNKIEVSKRVLTTLSTTDQNMQLEIWKRIRLNPTLDVLSKTVSMIEKKMKERGKKKKPKDMPDPQVIFEKFKEAYEKDNSIIYQFFTPKKIEKLIKGNL